METGWIKISRNIINWRWYRDPIVKSVFLHCLLMAQINETEYKDENIEAGQFITTIGDIANALGLTYRQVNYALSKLSRTCEIEKRRSKDKLVVKVCKFADYQGFSEESCKSNAKHLQNICKTNVKTYNSNMSIKEDKNERKKEIKESNLTVTKESTSLSLTTKKEQNKKALEVRRKSFFDSLVPYVEMYGREMIRSFYDYWSESNKSFSKMKFETEPTWELTKRLDTWERNSHKYDKQQKQQPATSKEIVW